MANNDFETNLIIRGQDLASQPIAQIIETTKKLSAALIDNAKASESGQGSMNGLVAASRDTQQAFSALLSLQGRVEQFGNTVNRLGDAKAALDPAKAALEAYVKSVTDAGEKVKRGDTQFKALSDAIKEQERIIKSAEKSIATLGKAFEKQGIDTTKLSEVTSILKEALLSTSDTLKRGEAAWISHNENQRKAREAIAATAAEEKKQAQLAAANAKLIEDAEKKKQQAVLDTLRASAESLKQRQAYQAQEARDAAAQAAETRRLQGFQGSAAAGLAAQPALSPAGQSPNAASEFSSTAAALAGILNPSAQVRATLDGVEAEVGKLGEALAKEKPKVDELAAALKNGNAAASALEKQAAKIDAYQAQQAALAKTVSAINAEEAALRKLDSEIKNSTSVDAAKAAEVTSSIAKLAQLRAEYERQNATLTQLRAGLTAAKIDHTNLNAEVGRITTSAKVLTETLGKVREAYDNAAPSGHGGEGFLGVNLNSPAVREAVATVRHVIDQLGAGASAMSAVESHLGNIIQLMIGNFAKLVPYLAPAAAGIAGVAFAIATFSKAAEEANAVRNFQARLDITTDSAISTGRELTKITEAIQHLGTNFADAQKSVQIFLTDGLNPAHMVEFGGLAIKLAHTLGIEVPEAAKKLSAGLTGGSDAVVGLLTSLGLLSPATQHAIDQAIEEGDADAVRAAGLKAVKDRVDGLLDPVPALTKAITDLKNAFDGFFRFIANSTVIQGLITQFTSLLRLVGAGIQLLGGDVTEAGKTLAANNPFGGSSAPTDPSSAAEAARKIPGIESQISAKNKALAGITGDGLVQTTQREDLQRQLAILQQQLKVTNDLAESGKRIVVNDTQRAGLAAKFLEQEELRAKLEKIRQEAPGQRKADLAEEYLEAFRKKETEDALNQGLDPKTQEDTRRAIDIRVARERERLDVQNQRGGTQADRQNALALQGEEAAARGLKGPARAASDARIEDLKVEIERGRLIKEGAFKTDEEREAALSKYRRQLAEGDARERANAGQSAADKVQGAEDNLAKELLSIKQKLLGQDKTNLADRLAGIDAEFAKYELKVQEARRKGASNIPGVGSISAFEGELAAAKQKAIDDATLDSQLANIKTLEEQRKAALTSVSALAAKGGEEFAAAMAKALLITAQIDPQIKAAGAAALKTAQDLNAKNPSAKTGLAIETATAAVNDSGGGRAGADQLLKPANEAEKTRNDLIAAARKLQEDGVQDATTTQNQIKRAYDLTNDSIQNAIKATQAYIDAGKQAGTILPADYELINAKLKDLSANSTFATDDQKELAKGIENAFEKSAVNGINLATQSLGKFIAGHEKLKDLVADVGRGFATMTADILKDIAQIIVKQQIMNALGFGGKKGSGSGDGSVDETGGGVLGFVNDLFGSNKKPANDNSGSAGKLLPDTSAPDTGSVDSGNSDSGGFFSRLFGGGGSSSQALSSVNSIARGASGGGIGGILNGGLGLINSLFNADGYKGGTAGAIASLFGSGAGVNAAEYTSAIGPTLGGTGFLGGELASSGAAAASSGGGLFSGVLPFITSLFAHSGATVGENAPTRRIDPRWFANAPRFHEGSAAVGIKPGEMPAILQKGETVMTAAQTAAANVGAAGKGSPAASNIRNVLVLDPKELSSAMTGSHGEQVVLNHIKANAGAVRTMIRG